MKRLSKLLKLILFVCTSNAFATDAVVNFVGELTQAGCVVSGGKNLTVTLPTLPVTDVAAFQKDHADYKGRGVTNITLNNCPNRLQVSLQGTADSNYPKYLKNIAADNAAQGVAVQVWFGGHQILLGEAPQNIGWMANHQPGAPADLEVVGHIIRTADAVTAGKIQSMGELLFFYN